MRAVIVVRSPAQAEHVPAEDGQAVPGGVPDEPAPRACQAVTKAGDPCKGTPGDDGFCAAHKPKGDAGEPGGEAAGAGQAPEEA
jgi:hypothetical protein